MPRGWSPWGATGGPGPTLAGYDALRNGGTLVPVGGVRQDLVLPYGDAMPRRLTIRGSWMTQPQTVLDLWALVRSGRTDLGVLDVHTVGLDDPDAALDLAARTSVPGCVGLVA